MIYNIVFSATGRCEAVLNEITQHFEGEKIKIDLSRQEMDAVSFTKDDLCFVAASVFEGRIPYTAVENMKKLSGNGAKAVLITVYGNRAIDDALAEMQFVLANQGFECVAGVEAVAQHSIFTQYGVDRPDDNDKKELKEFAEKIKDTLENGTEGRALILPGNVPQGRAKGLPFVPKVTNKCVDCKKCAKSCPAAAIPLDNPRITDKEKCMLCMRCIEICPANARVVPLPKPVFALMGKAMGKRLGGYKLNKLYLPQ